MPGPCSEALRGGSQVAFLAVLEARGAHRRQSGESVGISHFVLDHLGDGPLPFGSMLIHSLLVQHVEAQNILPRLRRCWHLLKGQVGKVGPLQQ